MFGSGYCANRTVSDMVIGNHQTLVGNHAAAAHAAVDCDYGIAQCGRLLVIEGFGLQFETHPAHTVVHLRIDALYKPHTLVGNSREGCEHHQNR